jgi:peptidoglycan/LPS O-acetylase OafA/YrhL
MVDLFFVLSGFVIYGAYSTKIQTLSALKRFQFLRLGRLYPVHFLFLILFLFVEIAKYLAISDLGISDIRAQPFGKNNLGALIQQLLLIQAIGPTGNALTFNGPAWSISVEFFTYLIFATIILFAGRFNILLMFILAFGALALKIGEVTLGFGLLLSCVSGFFLGSITAHWVFLTSYKPPAFLSGLLLILIMLFLQLKPKGSWDELIYFLSAALIASLVLAPEAPLNRFLRLKIFTWLGLISYSIYMSHTFVLLLVSNFYKRVLNFPEVKGTDDIWRIVLTPQQEAVALLATIVLVLIISHLCYRWVEKPFRDWSRRFVSRVWSQ